MKVEIELTEQQKEQIREQLNKKEFKRGQVVFMRYRDGYVTARFFVGYDGDQCILAHGHEGLSDTRLSSNYPQNRVFATLEEALNA